METTWISSSKLKSFNKIRNSCWLPLLPSTQFVPLIKYYHFSFKNGYWPVIFVWELFFFEDWPSQSFPGARRSPSIGLGLHERSSVWPGSVGAQCPRKRSVSASHTKKTGQYHIFQRKMSIVSAAWRTILPRLVLMAGQYGAKFAHDGSDLSFLGVPRLSFLCPWHEIESEPAQERGDRRPNERKYQRQLAKYRPNGPHSGP